MGPTKNSFIINKTYDPLILKTILKRYWWWPMVFMGIMITLAFFYLRYTKPIYDSNLILQLDNEDTAKEVLDVANVNSKQDKYFSNIELMRSQLLFEDAIRSLGLNVSLYSKGQVLTEEKYLSSNFNIQPYALNDSTIIGMKMNISYDGKLANINYQVGNKSKNVSGKLGDHIVTEEFDLVVKSSNPAGFAEESNTNELYFIFNSVESLSARLLPGLQVAPVEVNAQTVRIGYRGYNPLLCRDISNAVAKSFLVYDDRMKTKGSENVLQFIDQQLDSLSIELKKSKDSLMFFQRTENLPDPDGVGESLRGDVQQMQDKLFTIEDEITTLIRINKQLNESPNRLEVFRILPELLGKSFESSLATHIQELHTLMESKEDLLFTSTEENDEVQRINRKIENKNKLILRSINTITNRLQLEARLIKDKINGLEADYFSLPEKKMEFNRLKNIQDLNEKYFQLLTEKKVLYSISDAGFASSNRILNKATLSYVPVAPNSRMIYSAFTIFGLLLGLGVLFLRYITFNEINLLEDLENLLPEKASILGGVPLFKYNLEYSQLIVAEAPKSMMAEAMRKIRTNLSYIHPDYKTVAISSSISGEGKTFVALNLAGIISMSGKKTILLDLDMRKPKVHLGFGVENTHGMSSLIVGQSTLEQCIHVSVAENLDFITAGPVPPNPSELLLSKKFKEIVENLKQSYDVIVIDNPPVGLVSDGVKILTDADIPIYVFKSHYSKRNFAYRVKELFEMQQLSSLNVILNGVQNSKRSVYGYGYGYGYGGYGYGYGAGYVDEDPGDKFKQENRIVAFIKRLFNRNGNN